MGRIFISHRHSDSFDAARRLATTLKYAHKHKVFIDANIDGGTIWPHELEREIQHSDAMIVLIGPDWLDATDEKGNRRLNDPADNVRNEVAGAFKLDKFVLPVLLNGASMPSRHRLPEPLQELAGRHAVHLNTKTNQFEADVRQISKALRRSRRLARIDAAKRMLKRVSAQNIPAWQVLAIVGIAAIAIYFLVAKQAAERVKLAEQRRSEAERRVDSLQRENEQLKGENAGPQSKATAGRLEQIKDRGWITLGYRESSIPFSYISSETNRPVGFSINICMEIVSAVEARNNTKLGIRYESVTPNDRLDFIQKGQIDLECGSTTNNEARSKLVNFTNTHFLTRNRFASKKSSNIRSKSDLGDRFLVVIRGTTNELQLNNKGIYANLKPESDHYEGFSLLENNKADAFFLDEILLRGLIANSKRPNDYVLSDEAFSEPEPYGIMLPKGDAAFKEVADNATAALYRSGRIFELYNKWFKKPVPAYKKPGTINLNYDMPPELKKAFEKPTDSSNYQDYR